MQRKQKKYILKDLRDKMVFISGPRQVGKTFLSRDIYNNSYEYLTYDDSEDRQIILKKQWSREKKLIILDELHKFKDWKRLIKGVFDKEGIKPQILVTGSARLDIFRKGGDSLAGRYFLHRLHPFSISELKNKLDEEDILERLMITGGFPEPFLKGSEAYAKRWQRTHIDRIIKEDLRELENIREISTLELLIDFLSRRVGSTVSYASLARDLQVSPHTVKKWITILESFYIIFIVKPYSNNLARAINKEPKIYFYDTSKVIKKDGPRVENIVACALIKRLHFIEDTIGDRCRLHFVRDREKREVDFLTVRDNSPEYLIEVKNSDSSLSSSLRYFSKKISVKESIQLVKKLKKEMDVSGIKIRTLSKWLGTLEN